MDGGVTLALIEHSSFYLDNVGDARTFTLSDEYSGANYPVTFRLDSCVRRDNGYSTQVDFQVTVSLGRCTGGVGRVLAGSYQFKDTLPHSWDAGVYSHAFNRTQEGTGEWILYEITVDTQYEIIRNYDAFKIYLPAGQKKAVLPPSVSAGWFTVARDNSGTAASGITEWVKGFSKARVTFDPSKVTTSYPSTGCTFSIIYNGVETQASGNVAATGTITDASATITIKATENYEGAITTTTQTISLLQYNPPTITGAQVYRSNASKAASDTGQYITAKATPGFTSLNGKNRATLTAKYKPVGGSYGSAVTLSSNTLTIINASTISTLTSYTVLLEVSDLLGYKATYEANVLSQSAAFHLKSGGKGAAFGKVSEKDNTLEIAWELEAILGVIAGNVNLKITRINSDIHNLPSGWTIGVFLMLGKQTDSDRYFLAIQSNGKLFTGYALSGGATITWTEK